MGKKKNKHHSLKKEILSGGVVPIPPANKKSTAGGSGVTKIFTSMDHHTGKAKTPRSTAADMATRASTQNEPPAVCSSNGVMGESKGKVTGAVEGKKVKTQTVVARRVIGAKIPTAHLYTPLPAHVLKDPALGGIESTKELGKSASGDANQGSFAEKFVKSVLVDKPNVDVNISRKLAGKVLMLENTATDLTMREHQAAADKAKKGRAYQKKDGVRFKGPSGFIKKEFNPKMKTVVKGIKYTDLKVLNQMWNEYMTDLLQLKASSTAASIEAKLSKADLHGCSIVVTKSKCPNLVNLSGIVLKETKNSFEVMTPQDRVKVFPKANSVFALRIGKFICEIYGTHLCYRSADRVKIKFKSKPTVDL
eukprot:Nk52_evm53s224 gene=Nk52_evmTU53s224